MGVRSTDTNGTPSNPKGLNERIDGHLLAYFRDDFSAGGAGSNFVPAGFSASGGNRVNPYTDPDGFQYKAHIFTSSGSFVVDTADGGETVEYLIIGGGGGGGAWVGGGGGAGGVISSHPDYPSAKRSSVEPVSQGPYAVVIGGGGTGSFQDGESASNTQETGTPGGDTTVFSKRAAGGGMGGNWAMYQREAGGSGGGGGHPAALTGADGNTYSPASPAHPGPAPNQGFPGGNGSGTPQLSTGGGGGAGGAGGNFSGTTSGNGGAGVQITIAGAPTYNHPVGRGDLNPGPGEYMWYAAGGGGGHHGPGTAGTGGVGGGGDGRSAGPEAPAGLDGTGGGGGGSGGSGGTGHGGNGGSGLVIIRYRIG
tara:strand:+ start:153 stop:1247 length:1095 start_codon:yes stop_codon:yes gene_type:complete